MIGIGGTDHDLEIMIDIPKILDRFETVPSGRHTHIHKGHRVRMARPARSMNHTTPLLPLRCELKRVVLMCGKAGRLPEQGRSRLIQRARIFWRLQYLTKVLVDGEAVV